MLSGERVQWYSVVPRVNTLMISLPNLLHTLMCSAHPIPGWMTKHVPTWLELLALILYRWTELHCRLNRRIRCRDSDLGCSRIVSMIPFYFKKFISSVYNTFWQNCEDSTLKFYFWVLQFSDKLMLSMSVFRVQSTIVRLEFKITCKI